jgi:hypothetical protein
MSVVKQEKQCTCKRNIEERSRNHHSRRKAIIITYFACVPLALITQYALRMHRIIICVLPRCTVLSQHYSMKGTIFGEKELDHKINIFIFSVFSVCNISNSQKI